MTPTEQQRQKIEELCNAKAISGMVSSISAVRISAEYILTHLSEFLPVDEDADARLIQAAAYYSDDHSVSSAYRDGCRKSPYRALYEAMKQDNEHNAVAFIHWIQESTWFCNTTDNLWYMSGRKGVTTIQLYEIFKQYKHADKTAE